MKVQIERWLCGYSVNMSQPSALPTAVISPFSGMDNASKWYYQFCQLLFSPLQKYLLFLSLSHSLFSLVFLFPPLLIIIIILFLSLSLFYLFLSLRLLQHFPFSLIIIHSLSIFFLLSPSLSLLSLWVFLSLFFPLSFVVISNSESLWTFMWHPLSSGSQMLLVMRVTSPTLPRYMLITYSE